MFFALTRHSQVLGKTGASMGLKISFKGIQHYFWLSPKTRSYFSWLKRPFWGCRGCGQMHVASMGLRSPPDLIEAQFHSGVYVMGWALNFVDSELCGFEYPQNSISVEVPIREPYIWWYSVIALQNPVSLQGSKSKAFVSLGCHIWIGLLKTYPSCLYSLEDRVVSTLFGVREAMGISNAFIGERLL